MTNGVIDLDASTAGNYTIKYVTPGTCPDSSTQDVTITTPSTDFNYGGATEFCLGTTNPVATITGAAGGTFSATSGLTIDVNTGEIDLSSAAAGNYEVTYTPPGNWQQIGLDIDGVAGDNSGSSVSMNAAGDRLAIGAPSSDFNRGHVSIYDWNGSSWVQLGQDIDGEAFQDRSGQSISFNSTGDIVAIGAKFNAPPGLPQGGVQAGHVRIYSWNGSSWVQIGQYIDGESQVDFSGTSVSLNATGLRIAIGAPLNDANSSNTGASIGHVRIYEWNGSTWVQVGQDIDGERSPDELSLIHISEPTRPY